MKSAEHKRAAQGTKTVAAKLFRLLDKKRGYDSDDALAAELVRDSNPDQVVKKRTLDKRQATPLHLAVKRGCQDTVEALIHARADPDDGDILFGRTPFWEAASFGHVALLKRLLVARADPNITPTRGPSTGWTPLDIAKKQGRTDAEVLLRSLEEGSTGR